MSHTVLIIAMEGDGTADTGPDAQDFGQTSSTMQALVTPLGGENISNPDLAGQSA